MGTSNLTRIIKRIALISGIAILLFSIQFSYDGFDQKVVGTNSGYTVLAVIIGYTLALVFSVIQFIFGTANSQLNWTLRTVGVFAYVYSIYTNYLGIKHLLGADEFMSWTLAIIMDVFPEPAIAWSLGESVTGDLLGNIGKIILGTSEPPKKESRPEQRTENGNNGSNGHKPNHPVQKSKYQAKHKPTFGPIRQEQEAHRIVANEGDDGLIRRVFGE